MVVIPAELPSRYRRRPSSAPRPQFRLLRYKLVGLNRDRLQLGVGDGGGHESVVLPPMEYTCVIVYTYCRPRPLHTRRGCWAWLKR